jgi:MFS family permease
MNIRPVGIAAAFAAILNGKLMDFNYRRWAKRLNMPLDKKRHMDLRNFPIEKARLQPVFLLIPIGVAAYIPMGWVLQQRVSLVVPLILEFISGFCFVACSNTLSSLLVDLFPESPAVATAACNLLRCCLAGGATAAISPMLNSMGWGWCFTFLGLIVLLGLLLLWCDMRWGMEWREERRLRNEKKLKDSTKETLDNTA